MTSENNVTVYVRSIFSDLIHANRLYRASTANDHIGRLLIGSIFLLLGGCAWILFAAQPARTQNSIDLSFPATFGLVLVGLALIFDLIPTILLWITFIQSRQRYFEPYQAIFDDDGVSVQRQGASVKYEWKIFYAAVEGRDEFILIYGKNLYFGIPKTSFQDQNDEENFRSMLKSKVKVFKQKLKFPMDIRWKRAN